MLPLSSRCIPDRYSSEHLKSVPELLETLMSEKRLLQASVLLVRSLKIINKPDMLEIGAVADLRSYLNGQDTVRPIYNVTDGVSPLSSTGTARHLDRRASWAPVP